MVGVAGGTPAMGLGCTPGTTSGVGCAFGPVSGAFGVGTAIGVGVGVGLDFLPMVRVPINR